MFETTLEIPENTNVEIKENNISVKGEKGEVSKKFDPMVVQINREGNSVKIVGKLKKRRGKAIVGTWKSHLSNMFEGVNKGYTYVLKLVYAHFPIKIEIQGKTIKINNYVGEKVPRLTSVVGDTKVEIKGTEIHVTGPNKEHVGQTAANLEQTTRMVGRDKRVFQDGCYLIRRSNI